MYHENMAAFDISEIIKLIPGHKLTTGSVCNEESEFDVGKVVADTLANPLNFPTLDQAILAEDTVCIPVEPGIPSEELIASRVATAVSELGVPQSQITVLLPEGATPGRVDLLQAELETLNCGDCSVVVHHANEPEHIGYLGPSESGEPITLNARLVHADFVLPIGRAKPFGWKSQADFLYPWFSDVESQKRFFKLNLKNRIRLNQEVHRWLGNCFLISAAARVQFDGTGEHQNVGTLISGENDSVQVDIQKYCQSLASKLEVEQGDSDSPSQHDLVIARIGPHLCISEEEISDLIEDLKELCSENGSIVLLWCDDVEVPMLVEREDGEETSVFDTHNETHKIYLKTEQGLLKQLGMSKIDSLKEIESLVEQHQSVLLLPDFINEFAYHRPLVWNDKSTGAMA